MVCNILGNKVAAKVNQFPYGKYLGNNVAKNASVIFLGSDCCDCCCIPKESNQPEFK